MDDFYSRTGERKSMCSKEQEKPWVPWAGGIVIAIVFSVMIVYGI